MIIENPESSEVHDSRYPTHFSSKLKTYGFATAIIVGIGGLGVAAAGVAGYFHVGALSNMAQIDAIIMMAAGGGGGIIMMMIGIVGSIKNHQSDSSEQAKTISSSERAKIIETIDTKDGTVYGPEAWEVWNVEVLDVVPPPPQVDLSAKNKILLYIPRKIRFEGKEQDLTLKILEKIGGDDSIIHIDSLVENETLFPEWVLIDRDITPDSLEKDHKTQEEMVKNLPYLQEAVVLNLMVYEFTKKRLSGAIRCAEKVKKYEMMRSVVVGTAEYNFIRKELYLQIYTCNVLACHKDMGTVSVQRNF